MYNSHSYSTCSIYHYSEIYLLHCIVLQVGRQKQEGLKAQHNTPYFKLTTYNLGKCNCNFLSKHSLIRGVLIQSCSAGAKMFTNYVFCNPQFSGVIQNIENRCAILTLFVYVDYYQNNQFYRVKIGFFKILPLWHNDFQYFG